MSAGNRKGSPMYRFIIGALVLAAASTFLIEIGRSASKSDQPPNQTAERLENIQHIKNSYLHGVFYFTVHDPMTKQVMTRYISLSKHHKYKIFVDVPEDQPMWVDIWRDPKGRDPKNIQRAEIHVRCSSDLLQIKDLPRKCSGP